MPNETSPASNSDPKFRVKVYELNEEGEWGDKGTGHVQFQVIQSVEAAYMFVHSETDGALLLESKVIMDDDVYQRQGDTIISWSEPYSRQDLALSFAESAGCQAIWEKLCAVRGVDPNAAPADDDPAPAAQTYTLPPVGPNQLSQIHDFLSDLSPFMREGVAATMVQEDYVKQLIAEARKLNPEKDGESLRILYMIIKSMIMMNETNLLEQLLSNDCYLDVFGILEHDPDLPVKPKHREFLQTVAQFKQIVPFEDPQLVTRIHQNFRVQYLKDVVLPRVMDDATFGTLNSIIFFNSIEIVGHLQNDKKFLTEVFSRLKACNPATAENKDKMFSEQRDLMALLQEMCGLSKNLQMEQRVRFFKNLHENGIMTVFESAMRNPHLPCRLSAFEVLSTCVTLDPSSVRVFMLEQEHEFGLLRELITRIIEDPDHGIKGQASEILRLLLDPESMDQSQEKNQFLNTFYEKFLERMITVFSPDVETKGLTRADLNVARNHVCELMTFFVQNHGYRIKYFVLRKNIVGKVCELMKEQEKYIALSAVRFVRACVGLKDEFYFRYMIKNNSFAPIVELFHVNGTKYNLLNSAIIDLFEYIRKENIKSLIAYIADKFEKDLKPITYVDTFNGIWLQHQKNREFLASNGPLGNDASADPDNFGAADAEDTYFAGNGDDADDYSNKTAGATTSAHPDQDVVFTDANAQGKNPKAEPK